jgi:hypothetical protein
VSLEGGGFVFFQGIGAEFNENLSTGIICIAIIIVILLNKTNIISYDCTPFL